MVLASGKLEFNSLRLAKKARHCRRAESSSCPWANLPNCPVIVVDFDGADWKTVFGGGTNEFCRQPAIALYLRSVVQELRYRTRLQPFCKGSRVSTRHSKLIRHVEPIL